MKLLYSYLMSLKRFDLSDVFVHPPAKVLWAPALPGWTRPLADQRVWMEEEPAHWL